MSSSMTLLTEQDLELSSSPSDTCPSESSASPQPATGDVSCSSEPPPSIAPLEAREKRRRSRVTPEQLLHLEQYFATDRSPTGARRKEIGDLLGMHERQTQIWFQNRRAKAKLHDGKIKLSSVTKLHFAVQPPELCAGFDHDLQSLVHEDESIIIIPCTELSVGTWKRIGITKYDLVAYICEAKKCITWFIHSAGHSFKMELPFNTIVDTSFTNVAPGMGVAILRLIQPPLFYLEHIAATDPNGTPIRLWQQCVDWTEGMQASKVMYHELTGSVVQLAPILQYLKFNELGDRMSSYMPSQPTILPSSGRLSTATMLSHDQSSGPLYVYPGSRSPSHESLSLIPCDSFDSQSRNPSGVFEHASFCSLDYSASSVTGGPSSAGYPSSSTLPGSFGETESLQHYRTHALLDEQRVLMLGDKSSSAASPRPFITRADSQNEYPLEPPSLSSASRSDDDTLSLSVPETPFISPSCCQQQCPTEGFHLLCGDACTSPLDYQIPFVHVPTPVYDTVGQTLHYDKNDT